MSFTFRLYRHPDRICEFILGDRLWIPREDYPDFFDWAAKIHNQLKKEEKLSYCCFRGRELVGSLIFQEHKTQTGFMELKNMTVVPSMRNRLIASFLLRNTEIEGRDLFQSRFAICDAKEDNISVRQFLLEHNYTIFKTDNLYRYSRKRDNIFIKAL